MYKAIVNDLYNTLLKQNEKTARKCLEDANKAVPVDTGELLNSGKVVTKGNKSEVIYDAPHAIYVHEIPTHTGYKFLERTVDQNRQHYHQMLRERS